MSLRFKARRIAPPSTAAEPKAVPISWERGSFTAGDSCRIPDGYARLIENMLLRPGPRLVSRPPFKYDSLMNVSGLMLWEDLANDQSRFLALDTSRNLYMKGATGETWSGAVTGTITGSRVTDSANYRGKIYYVIDDGDGNPVAAASFDGVTITPNPFNTIIFGRTITTYIDRLFIAYPRVPVVNLLGTTKAYIATGGNWTLANVTAENIASGTSTTGRLTPTSTTDAVAYVTIESIVALATPTFRMFRCDLQPVSATYDMPMTISLRMRRAWDALDGFTAGGLCTPSATNGFRYRALNTGTAAAVEPVWPTTLGATIVDDTITWICDAPSTLGSREIILVNATESPDFAPTYVLASLPPTPDDYLFEAVISFGNTAIPTITLAPVNFAYRDAITDGLATKKNHGQQVTAGDFFAPFFNQESSATAIIDLETIICTEPGEPGRIRSSNTFDPKEMAGLPTAARVVGGRYIMWKRRGLWQFLGQADPDFPILPERLPREDVGCIGPLAVDGETDEAFWISENDCLRFRIGDDPKGFCGEAMREEIMANGANWVESQATYNMPLLAMNKKRKEVWVYTQKSLLYCYNIERDAWTRHTTPNNVEVSALEYNPTTKLMYVSFGGQGLCRLDEALTKQDDLSNAATLYPVTKSIIYRPFELYTPRAELCLHDIGLYHLATYTQAAEALWVYVSFDNGSTYPKYNEVRFSTAVKRIAINLFQSGVSVGLKVDHVGSAGEAVWALSGAEAYLELLAGEWPESLPTAIASSL